MTLSKVSSISVIVKFFNWPGSPRLSLQPLASQTERYVEVIIADDWSRPDTADVIEALARSASVPVSSNATPPRSTTHRS